MLFYFLKIIKHRHHYREFKLEKVQEYKKLGKYHQIENLKLVFFSFNSACIICYSVKMGSYFSTLINVKI